MNRDRTLMNMPLTGEALTLSSPSFRCFVFRASMTADGGLFLGFTMVSLEISWNDKLFSINNSLLLDDTHLESLLLFALTLLLLEMDHRQEVLHQLRLPHQLHL